MQRADCFALAAAGALAAAVLYVARSRKRAPPDKKPTPPDEKTPPDEAWEHHTCRMPARMPAAERQAVLRSTTLEDRTHFFAASECPITEAVEQRMEAVSMAVSKENYNEHWEAGTYACARCGNPIYSSDAKFVGPCAWPSFRKPKDPISSLHTIRVPPGVYNKYTCEVHEIYCGGCRLVSALLSAHVTCHI